MIENGRFKNIKQVEQDWHDAFVISYCIDVLPFGKNTDYYFHRGKNLFSNSINGNDIFSDMSNVSKDIKVLTENMGIEEVGWRMDRDGLILSVNRKLVLSVPIVRFAELQIHGKIYKTNIIDTDEQKIKIPIVWEDGTRNQPKEFIEVLEQTSEYSTQYRNSFCSVSAFPTADILYWR